MKALRAGQIFTPATLSVRDSLIGRKSDTINPLDRFVDEPTHHSREEHASLGATRPESEIGGVNEGFQSHRGQLYCLRLY